MIMTWDQFKRAVDEKLNEKGRGGDTHIWFIDVTYPRMIDYGEKQSPSFDVFINRDGDILIS